MFWLASGAHYATLDGEQDEHSAVLLSQISGFTARA
jgi:hypothetical protein